MSFTLSDRSSILSSSFYPPIDLKENVEYELGLVSFMSYFSIPNIDETNSDFHYYDGEKLQKISVPEGCYELTDIYNYLTDKISEKESTSPSKEPTSLIMKVNHSTLRCEIKSNKKIDFTKPKTIGSLLGFKPRILFPNVTHTSEKTINISKVNSISVECNLITNSYNNGKPVHILHTFYPTVPPGYKIVEIPRDIYLPINSKRINEIVLKIVDQNGKLVNFRNELITIRLHLRERKK